MPGPMSTGPISDLTEGVEGQGVTRAVTETRSMEFPQSFQRMSQERFPEAAMGRQGTLEQPDVEPLPPSEDLSSPDPVEVPVPEPLDDELVRCGYVCIDQDDIMHVDQSGPSWGFRQEVLIDDRDIDPNGAGLSSADLAYIVSASKKQRNEVKLQQLSPDEKAEFDKAMTSEINNWLKTGTVKKLLRNQVAEHDIIRCRWILTWKPLDPQDVGPGQRPFKAKARLVILGFMDPQLDSIPRDSPTLGRVPKMLLLQAIASHSWHLRSFDVKAAFLQGEKQEGRQLAVEPVAELRKAMGLGPNEICQLNKGAYGLIDAPYLWYKTFVEFLRVLGFQQSPFDPCLFTLRHEDGRLSGILGIHVDDGLAGGDALFAKKVDELEKKFPFGSKKSTKFTFTGIELSQKPDYSITLSQSDYIRKIKPISLTPERRAQEDAEITEAERQSLRALIGSLQYAAIHTRPDLSCRLNMLQSQVNRGKVSTLIEANRTLHEGKRNHDVAITINAIPPQSVRFLAFSDASFSSPNVPDSYAGLMIVAAHESIAQNQTCQISPIAWGSKKIQRVVTSTLAAETASLSTALDHLSWTRLCWAWILDETCDWRRPSETLKHLPPSYSTISGGDLAATDCKSLFDLVSRTAPPSCSEFRTQLQAKAIKDMLSEGTALKWVHSGAQLADALTKLTGNASERCVSFARLESNPQGTCNDTQPSQVAP